MWQLVSGMYKGVSILHRVESSRPHESEQVSDRMIERAIGGRVSDQRDVSESTRERSSERD